MVEPLISATGIDFYTDISLIWWTMNTSEMRNLTSLADLHYEAWCLQCTRGDTTVQGRPSDQPQDFVCKHPWAMCSLLFMKHIVWNAVTLGDIRQSSIGLQLAFYRHLRRWDVLSFIADLATGYVSPSLNKHFKSQWRVPAYPIHWKDTSLIWPFLVGRQWRQVQLRPGRLDLSRQDRLRVGCSQVTFLVL